MKLKLSDKSLDSISACHRGKKSLLDQRSWFQNLFDSSMEVQCYHLYEINYKDIKWFMERFVLCCNREDLTKIISVIYDHVVSSGLEDLYEDFLRCAIIRFANNAKDKQDSYFANYVIIYMKYRDIIALAQKLLEVDYSCDYSNPCNWEKPTCY